MKQYESVQKKGGRMPYNSIIHQITTVLLTGIFPILAINFFARIITPKRFQNREVRWFDQICNIYLCGTFIWGSYNIIGIFQRQITGIPPENQNSIIGSIIIISLVIIWTIFVIIFCLDKIPNKSSIKKNKLPCTLEQKKIVYMDKYRDKVQLSNIDGTIVENVGELKKILKPFKDECKINNLRVFYKPINDGKNTKLEITLVTC